MITYPLYNNRGIAICCPQVTLLMDSSDFGGDPSDPEFQNDLKYVQGLLEGSSIFRHVDQLDTTGDFEPESMRGAVLGMYRMLRASRMREAVCL